MMTRVERLSIAVQYKNHDGSFVPVTGRSPHGGNVCLDTVGKACWALCTADDRSRLLTERDRATDWQCICRYHDLPNVGLRLSLVSPGPTRRSKPPPLGVR